MPKPQTWQISINPLIIFISSPQQIQNPRLLQHFCIINLDPALNRMQNSVQEEKLNQLASA